MKRIHPTVLLMASAHFMVDAYGNIYAPLLPLLIPKLHLSLAAAGTLTMLYQIASSVSQIGFGHIADRWRPRLFVMVGPVVAVAVLSFVGLAPNVGALAFFTRRSSRSRDSSAAPVATSTRRSTACSGTSNRMDSASTSSTTG